LFGAVGQRMADATVDWTRAASEGSAALKLFCDRLNEDRGKYVPMTIGRLGKMFAGRPIGYLLHVAGWAVALGMLSDCAHKWHRYGRIPPLPGAIIVFGAPGLAAIQL
jgi:hypothetical protein